jgi:hypothetical protein
MASDPRSSWRAAAIRAAVTGAVAFTIEFDNEAERQIQPRMSDHGGTPGSVWLVSMAMWPPN